MVKRPITTFYLRRSGTVRNGYGELNSNPERDLMTFTGKDMHPTILSSSMDKFEGSLGSFNLGWQQVLEKENTEFKLAKIC